MSRRLLCFLLAAGCWTATLHAAGPDGDGFARGNALYADKKFPEAASAYDTQVKAGHYSANLFYNLANAWYRQGDRGRAILNYDRALLLEPAHAEALANLAFVRGKVPAPTWSANRFTDWFSVDGWTWLAAAGGWLAVIGLGAAVFARRSRWLTLAAGLAGAAICGMAAWVLQGLHDGAKNPARAVVLADETRALYSPADNSKAVATLPAGGEVLLLSEEGGWDYVQLSDGSRGWMPAERVERVIPPAARS